MWLPVSNVAAASSLRRSPAVPAAAHQRGAEQVSLQKHYLGPLSHWDPANHREDKKEIVLVVHLSIREGHIEDTNTDRQASWQAGRQAGTQQKAVVELE